MKDIQAKLIAVLKDMFQFDQSDLDFGIYRIMAMKRAEITRFLETDLTAQIAEGLTELRELERSSVSQKRVEEIEKQCEAMGIDVQATKLADEYNRLKAELASGIDVSDIERDIYNQLCEFFSRYYDDGDFISQRRYKDGVYAIPYEGEEIKLHWANADQYYVKTSEYFKDYSFKNEYGQVCRFKLVDAETERDNNKAKEKRLFQLCAKTPFVLEGEDLTIFLEFKAGDKKQAAYVADIITALQGASDAFAIPAAWLLAVRDGKTKLERELNRYTAKNTFDYFIHKDLAGFLNRELDFFIKNEVFFIDDVDEQSFAHTRAYITKTKVMRKIARKIITFLAQIEGFQKRLYLKKKFVVETNYCITLDRVPESFYNDIANNDAQHEEWVRLFAINEITEPVAYSMPLTLDFLKSNPFLVLDTVFFSDEFKERLIAAIDNLDESLDGLLIHSENSQALRLLQEKYKRQVKCIYIDPPYNAKSSEILYKNNFKHASWLSLMENRLTASAPLMQHDGVLTVAIDEVEQTRLGELLRLLFPEKELTAVTIVHNPSGQQGDNFSFTHEFAYFVYPDLKDVIGMEERDEDNSDTRTFRDNSGNSNLRTDAANCFYPIFVRENKIVGFGDVCDDDFHPGARNIMHEDGTIAVYPIDNSDTEKKWVFERGTVESILDQLWVKVNGDTDIMRTKSVFRYKTTWTEKKYSANSYGSALITRMFNSTVFKYPKSIHTVFDCVNAGLSGRNVGVVLDYFAGSGTTAQAVINLNLGDNGTRKYILVEMGEYFDTATKPRVQKAIYSNIHGDDKYGWDKGKPTTRNGSSHAFKYLRLESYEDALQNITFQEEAEVPDLFAEEYLLHYLLSAEAVGQSLLPLDSLAKPFDYKMKITRKNESKLTLVDLPETFNYLIGLTVTKSHSRASFSAAFTEGQYGALTAALTEGDVYTFKTIEGTLPNGETALIIWRTLTGDINKDNAVLDSYRAQFGRFRKVFVNGDCNLDNAILIEEVMKQKMFEEV